MSKRKCSFREYPLILFLMVSFIFASPASLLAAGDADDEFAGEETVAAVEAASPFDDSLMFMPPDQLPVKDVNLQEMAGMSDEELAEDLETISITPDGKVEVLPADSSEIKMFKGEIEKAIKSLEMKDGEVEQGMKGDTEFDTLLESVIGVDTRTKVTNTTKSPFRKAGRIDVGCTGTLIGPRHVLTAGHCVYNVRSDKWYSNLNFSPGQNGLSRPYGTVGWKRAVSVKGWTKSHKRNYDYAMIILKKDIGKRVGWMGYGWKKPMPKHKININGYPGDKPFGTMWHAYCKMKKITTYRLYYPCDTAGGMSGSGVYLYQKSKNKRTIYGIHAYGVDSTGYNGATRIRKAVFERLKKWKKTY